MNDAIAFASGMGLTLAICLLIAVRRRAGVDNNPRARDTSRLDYLESSEVGVFCVKGVWGAMSNGMLIRQSPDLRDLLDSIRGQK